MLSGNSQYGAQGALESNKCSKTCRQMHRAIPRRNSVCRISGCLRRAACCYCICCLCLGGGNVGFPSIPLIYCRHERRNSSGVSTSLEAWYNLIAPALVHLQPDKEQTKSTILGEIFGFLLCLCSSTRHPNASLLEALRDAGLQKMKDKKIVELKEDFNRGFL